MSGVASMGKQFWVDAGERCVKAFAATLLALIGTGLFNVLHVAWVDYLGISAGSAVASLLMSLVSLNVGSSGTASLTRAVVLEKECGCPCEHGKHEARV